MVSANLYCNKTLPNAREWTLAEKINYETVKTQEGVLSSVIKHGWRHSSFQTVVQKNEAKLSSFVQSKNEIALYRAL